ncbi:Ppx/GppA phosphatase family protein [Ferrimonas gelatinilytica]|uniref:Exopolyphosphatase n=1 Tax=Ferrimonas gelatinilytica TaxID=1255257 RepID=A0ABP9RRT3_9GAMM
MNRQPVQVGDTIAAIDLGSNSFHLAIARVLENRIQLLHRVKQRVQLAEGMDEKGNLSETAMARGLNCLEQFAQQLNNSQISQVRAVATYALRRAPNRRQFLDPAHDRLGIPVAVIPGTEEARLIFRGVVQSQELKSGSLVIDIGGGSTELILGQGIEPQQLTSLNMGCVSYQSRHFPTEQPTPAQFQRAIIAARQQLEPLLSRYRSEDWTLAIGCSGTIKTLTGLCQPGDEPAPLERQSLEQLVAFIGHHGMAHPRFAGLSDSRRRVLPAGLSILLACMRSLQIEAMTFCDSALREGVLAEMGGEAPHPSVCAQTVAAMERLHHIDTRHGQRVAQSAASLYLHCPEAVPDLMQLLHWAGRLHETGLSLNFRHRHRHTGYILANSNLPGFTLEQQQLLAHLGRFHRKKLESFEPLDSQLANAGQQRQLLMALRLAVVWHLGRRHDLPLPELQWLPQGYQLILPPALADDPLLQADLLREQRELASAPQPMQLFL